MTDQLAITNHKPTSIHQLAVLEKEIKLTVQCDSGHEWKIKSHSGDGAFIDLNDFTCPACDESSTQ